ncbi:MAG TPA: FAD-dependent oxidoreductase [Terriglobales bacterium]|nr:FAD-dependent oxidoreductase [Terriglobales bacterium]
MRFVIIGGSDAGISAALRARERDSSAHITVILADAFPNYSICGLPFYLSGETPDWHQLAHCTEFEGIELLTNHTAQEFNPLTRTVTVMEANGRAKAISYDTLLIATGARPIMPSIPGIDIPGVFPLHTMEDSFRVHRHLEREHPQSAVIVGSGYIGLEMADALTHRGVKVTLIGRSKTVLPTVNSSFGRVVEDKLRSHGVRVESDCEVRGITETGGRLLVHGSRDLAISAELVLVGVGVQPNTAIGQKEGLRTGVKGAFCVNRRMEMNIAGVYAAGDCVETWHRLLGASTYLPLGTTSHKQGRVAGENAVGGSREFQGSLGTQVVKVFDLAIARTGVRDNEARQAGFRPFTVESWHFDHKAYYPGAQQLCISLTGDRQTGKLLGAQILGHWRSEVAKRIDVYATAIFYGMDIEAVNDLDLSYTPPFSSPWDPVQMAAQAWSRALA